MFQPKYYIFKKNSLPNFKISWQEYSWFVGFLFFFFFHFMMEKSNFPSFFSFSSSSSPFHSHLRLLLKPEPLPMMSHISALQKTPHVAGANLLKIPTMWNEYPSCNCAEVKMGQKMKSRPAFRHISFLGYIIQTCASEEALTQTLHWYAATAASQKSFSWHISAKHILLLLFKSLFNWRKYIVQYRNLSRVTAQRISENGLHWFLYDLQLEVQSGKADTRYSL